MGRPHYTKLQMAQIQMFLLEGKASNVEIGALVGCSERQIQRYRVVFQTTGTIYHPRRSSTNATKLTEADFQVSALRQLRLTVD